MRRSVSTLALTGALLVAATPAALATGTGGWSHVGVGATSASLNGTVTALNTENTGLLYVGGSFTSAGGRPKANRIAQWDGSSWGTVATTSLDNGQVFALASHAGRVYAGGTFVNAGGDADADFLAVWDGATWAPACDSTVPGPALTANVNALQIVGNTLFVGGSFQNGAGLASADYLVACDLSTGAASSTVAADGDFSGSVYALTADSNGTLFAGGGFINVAGLADADHVAAYDGAWHALGSGVAVDSFVRSLAASGTDVYVGSDSVDIAGIAQADHVARWNGAAWSALGSDTGGTDGWFSTTTTIDALTTSGSVLVAAGSFQNANGVATADNVAYFDGTTWRPLGSDGAGNGPFIGHPTALAALEGRIFVGGNFTSAGGDAKAAFLASYEVRLCDAIIGATPTSHLVGNNVYSVSGARQVREVTVRRGKATTSYVKIQNDGLLAGRFSLLGTGGAAGLRATYFDGSKNVTSAVRAGTFGTGMLAPRDTFVLRVVVKASRSASKNATFTTKVRSSTGRDAVRLAVTAKG